MLQIGALVTAVEKIPVRRRDVQAPRPAKADARLGDAAAFLADFFALFLVQAGQESIEVGVANITTSTTSVVPVELHRVAQHQPGAGAGGNVFVAGKQHVQRRHTGLLAPRPQRLYQGGARWCVAGHQARAGHRGKGHGNHGLGVVVQPMLGISARPSPIEHIFAIRMLFQVQRAGGNQRAALPQRDGVQRPAGVWRGAATALQCCQIFVAHERRRLRLALQQGIPRLRVHAVQRIEHAGDNCALSHAHSCNGLLAQRQSIPFSNP